MNLNTYLLQQTIDNQRHFARIEPSDVRHHRVRRRWRWR